jgi:hypothetical protein
MNSASQSPFVMILHREWQKRLEPRRLSFLEWLLLRGDDGIIARGQVLKDLLDLAYLSRPEELRLNMIPLTLRYMWQLILGSKFSSMRFCHYEEHQIKNSLTHLILLFVYWL